MQIVALLTLLDQGTDPATVAEPFGAWCNQNIEPWVADHVAIDGGMVKRWQGHDLDLSVPLTSDLIAAAAEADPHIKQHAASYFAMTALPATLARPSHWRGPSTNAAGDRPTHRTHPRPTRQRDQRSHTRRLTPVTKGASQRRLQAPPSSVSDVASVQVAVSLGPCPSRPPLIGTPTLSDVTNVATGTAAIGRVTLCSRGRQRGGCAHRRTASADPCRSANSSRLVSRSLPPSRTSLLGR